MGFIKKSVFISYRRKDLYRALSVYQYLTQHGYDVFFDYKSIPSGDFEQIIIGNIKARAHFLVILTPPALDRCDEPNDWLRREIETAISEKRNIIPLFFDGFDFKAPSISEKLSGQLALLKKYNGLPVPAEYFDEAMKRLRERFLNVTLDTVLHPLSAEVQKVVKAQKNAANIAILWKDLRKRIVIFITISIVALAIIGSINWLYPYILNWPLTPATTLTQPSPGITPTITYTPEAPALPPLVIANFDDCLHKTDLGGITGVTFVQPDRADADILPEQMGGCFVRLEYHLEKNFVTFYLKLANANFIDYNTLSFDIRADPDIGIPDQVKVELKRSDNSEMATYIVSSVTADWQTINVPFASFGPVSLSSLSDMSELVFTFEADHAGSDGAIYLDNILVSVR